MRNIKPKAEDYSLLGVSETSNLGEIKTAFRKLSLRLHPDVHNNDVFLSKQYVRIKQAYDTVLTWKQTELNKASAGAHSKQKDNQSRTQHQAPPKVLSASATCVIIGDQEEVTLQYEVQNVDYVKVNTLKPAYPAKGRIRFRWPYSEPRKREIQLKLGIGETTVPYIVKLPPISKSKAQKTSFNNPQYHPEIKKPNKLRTWLKVVGISLFAILIVVTGDVFYVQNQSNLRSWVLPVYLSPSLQEADIKLAVQDYFNDIDSVQFKYEIHLLFKDKLPIKYTLTRFSVDTNDTRIRTLYFEVDTGFDKGLYYKSSFALPIHFKSLFGLGYYIDEIGPPRIEHWKWFDNEYRAFAQNTKWNGDDDLRLIKDYIRSSHAGDGAERIYADFLCAFEKKLAITKNSALVLDEQWYRSQDFAYHDGNFQISKLKSYKVSGVTVYIGPMTFYGATPSRSFKSTKTTAIGIENGKVVAFATGKQANLPYLRDAILNCKQRVKANQINLYTGSQPYSDCYGRGYRCYSCGSKISVQASASEDAIVTIKQRGNVINHRAIRKGDSYDFTVDNGTYEVVFYAGSSFSKSEYLGKGDCGEMWGGFEKGGFMKEPYLRLNNQHMTYTLTKSTFGNWTGKAASAKDML